MDRTIGLLVPLHEEYQYLAELAPAVETTVLDGDRYYSMMPHGYKEPIVVQILEEMGPMRAALATERMISRFDVKVVALVGIAGALDDELRVGDVVVASEVDYYQYAAKAETGPSGEPRIRQGGMHWRADYELMQFIRSFSVAPEYRESYNSWRKLSATRQPQDETGSLRALMRDQPLDHVGPVASGDVVVAGDWLRAAIVERNRKVLAVEMEAAGVAAAAFDRADVRDFLVVRGVSDFADHRKSDFDAAKASTNVAPGAFRRYALLNAAEYFLRLAAEILRRDSQPARDHVAPSARAQVASPERVPRNMEQKPASTRRELEYELAERYSSADSIRRLFRHAGVEPGAFFARLIEDPLDRWSAAMELVEGQERARYLLEVVAADYPGVVAFKRALDPDPAQ
jgi:nucleoside phosphorylase